MKNLKSEQGFTLVELMIVVAIIGVLTSVAVPNFKKYQAKAKSSEAKVQLAAAYTAEQAFYGDYGIYSTCLKYMGYDPSREEANRYYAIGFSGTAGIHIDAHNSAIASGLSNGNCPRNIAAAQGTTFFRAMKTIGSAVIDTTAKVASTQHAGTWVGNCSTATAGSSAKNCLGSQSADVSMAFSIPAVGIISSDNPGTAASPASVWTINQDKRMTNHEPGY